MKSNLRFRLIATLCVLLASAVASALEKSWDDYIEAGRQAFQDRQYAEAEKQFKSAVQKAEEFETLAARRAHSLRYLGRAYSRQRKNAEAEEAYKGAIVIYEIVFGAEHPEAVWTLSNLGWLIKSQERYTEAEQLFDRALAILEKSRGLEHLDLTGVLDNMGWLYEDMDKNAEAESVFMRELTILEKNLGPEHLRVGRLLQNLGEYYSRHTKFAEGEQAFRRSLPIYKEHYGPEHWQVGFVLNKFAEAYLIRSKFVEAERLYGQALAIFEKSLGSEHTRTLRAERGLARSKRGTATAEGSSSRSPALVARAGRVEGNRPTASGAAEPQNKRQTFNVFDMSFEIPARGWELLAATETGIQLSLKYGNRRGESISIDRVLIPPRLRGFSREQHASGVFQMERRKRRPQGVSWKGFTEGERQIGWQVYPIMTFRVTYPPNLGVKQTGLFLPYFPEDFAEKNRFFSLTWTDTHPADEESRGLAEFDAFVSGLRIRPLSGGGALTQGDSPADSQGGGLVRAVREGRTADVKALLGSGADPNATDGKGIGGLVLAVIGGHIEIVQALLENGGDPNTKAGDGVTTVLMQASSIGHTEIVQALLAGGANVNTRGNSGLTALQLAVSKGHVLIVRELLAYGAAMDLPVFMAAKAGGHADTFKNALAPKRPAGLETELIQAVFEGKGDQVEQLLAAGADPNNTKDASGTTTLTRALKLWQLGLQRDALPLQLRSLLTGRDQPGVFAATRAYKRIVGLLKKEGAESTYMDLYLFGHLSDQQGEHEKALEAFREAVDLKPDFARGYQRIGTALGQRGRHKKALQAFQEAARLEPDSARNHHDIGFALTSLGRYEEAVEPYNPGFPFWPWHGHRIHPRCAEYHVFSR